MQEIIDAVDELLYRSYAHQRMTSPEVRPERWARLYRRQAVMERRYQQELRVMAEKVIESQQRDSGCYREDYHNDNTD